MEAIPNFRKREHPVKEDETEEENPVGKQSRVDFDMKKALAKVLQINPQYQDDYKRFRSFFYESAADALFVWFYTRGYSSKEQVRDLFAEKNYLERYKKLQALTYHIPEPFQSLLLQPMERTI